MEHYPSYEARLEANRQAQRYGIGVRKDKDGWEVYEWEKITDLQIHTQGLIWFEHKWQAEQYIYAVKNG
jgi:hypothetical protein